MSTPREEAKNLVLFYFGLAIGRLTADNRRELEEIVDHIVDAAKAELEDRLDAIEERLDHPDWRDRR